MLVTHFENGVKIIDKLGTKKLGLDRSQLARQVVEIYCQQIFTDGVYHADPHPGNLLVRPSPDGDARRRRRSCSSISARSPRFPANVRGGIAELIQGALTRDTRRIVGAMKQMGFVARGANEQVFEQVIEYFHERFQENISLDSLNLKDIKFDPQKGLESVADLRRMDISLRELSENFHVPKELIVLERTLLLADGPVHRARPDAQPDDGDPAVRRALRARRRGRLVAAARRDVEGSRDVGDGAARRDPQVHARRRTPASCRSSSRTSRPRAS